MQYSNFPLLIPINNAQYILHPPPASLPLPDSHKFSSQKLSSLKGIPPFARWNSIKLFRTRATAARPPRTWNSIKAHSNKKKKQLTSPQIIHAWKLGVTTFLIPARGNSNVTSSCSSPQLYVVESFNSSRNFQIKLLPGIHERGYIDSMNFPRPDMNFPARPSDFFFFFSS